MSKSVSQNRQQIKSLTEERTRLQERLAAVNSELQQQSETARQLQAQAVRSPSQKAEQAARGADYRAGELAEQARQIRVALQVVEQDLQQAQAGLREAERLEVVGELEALLQEANELAILLDEDITAAHRWARLFDVYREAGQLLADEQLQGQGPKEFFTNPLRVREGVYEYHGARCDQAMGAKRASPNERFSSVAEALRLQQAADRLQALR